MSTGRSLELFFVDGRPDGMLTAEVFNWTGHVLRIPKIKLPDGLKRKEARQTGVYILLGQNEDGPLAYIGETENMAERLKDHAAKKDWWDDAILITAAGDALHKAHVKYMESCLVEKALAAANIPLENENVPTKASLNEAATANMESFLETLHMVLPAIRVDLFQTRTRQTARDQQAKTGPQNRLFFKFTVKRNNLSATAFVDEDEFIVQKGAIVRAKWAGDRKHNTHYWKLHDELVSKGIIKVELDQGVLTENVAFSSPSAAAAIVAGRSSNGRTAWRTVSGQTFADWEKEQLEKAT